MQLEYARMARDGEFCSQPRSYCIISCQHLEIRKSINANETAFVFAFEMIES